VSLLTCLRERLLKGVKELVCKTLTADPDFVCCLTKNSNGEVKCDWMDEFKSPEEFKDECRRCKEEMKQMLQKGFLW